MTLSNLYNFYNFLIRTPSNGMRRWVLCAEWHMYSLSYRIIIVIRRIVLHTLCERYCLLHGWRFLQYM